MARVRLDLSLFVFFVVLLLYYVSSEEGTTQSVHGTFERALAHVNGLDETKFTIAILSFNRSEILRYNVATMAKPGAIPSLKEIVIVWPAEAVQGPPPSDFIDPSWAVPIKFLVRSDNFLSNRFLRLAEVSTQCVLTRDDDLTIHPSDLEFGFQVWRQHSLRMVGFVPRLHHFNRSTSRYEYDWNLQDSYSIILTGLAYVNAAILEAYWSPAISHLRRHVDDGFNCEDILMNFVAVNATRRAPILVKGNSDKMYHWKKTGISTQSGHKQRRDACVHHFFDYFGEDGLMHNTFTINKGLGSIHMVEGITFADRAKVGW